MRIRFLFSTVLMVCALLGAIPLSSFALTVSTPSITMDCNQVCINVGTTLTFDRDNLGNGFESNGFSVDDGIGTHLVGDGGDSVVGTSATYSTPQCYTYNTAPQYNPIIFRFISAAGNGYPVQIAYTTSGTCEGLPLAVTSVPTMTQWGMIIFMILGGLGATYWLRSRRRAKK